MSDTNENKKKRNYGPAAGVLTLLILLGIAKKKQEPHKGSPAQQKKALETRVKQILKGKYKMKNQEFINQLNAAVRDKFTQFIAEVESMGYVVAITSGYRSFAEQIILKNKDARNAAPGFSSHNYGTAIDMVLYKDGKMIGKGAAYTKAWLATGVPQLAKNKYKMRWGGDFPGYPDEVHFDYNNIYDTKKLYAMAIKQYGSADKAKGNELKLA